ncbi:methyl-accepting chemotaxis protein [Fundidesulfovibrio butyratiphilus]
MRIGVSHVVSLAVGSTILASVLGLLFYVSDSTMSLTESLSKQTLDQTAEATGRALDLLADQTDSLAMSLAQRAEVARACTGDAGPVQHVLADALSSFPGMQSIVIFDAKGTLVAGRGSDGQAYQPGRSYTDRSYASAILGGAQKALSRNVIKAKHGGALILVAARPVRDSAGNLLGGVGACANLNASTASLIEPLRFGKHGYGFVIDETGLIIAHSGDKALVGENLANQGCIQKILSVKNGVIECDWDNDAKVMALHRSTLTGWITVMAAQKAEIEAVASRQRTVLLIAGLAALAGIFLVIGLVTRQLILKPLRAVNDYADRVASGDYSAKLDMACHFELADLADHVRQMVEDLKRELGFSKGLLQGMPVACLVSDTKGDLLYINRPVLDFLEADGTPEDYIGKPVGLFFYGDASRSTITSQVVAEGRPLTKVRLEVPTRKGNMAFTQVDAAPLMDLSGECIGGVALFSDLSELRRQQLRVVEQNALIARTAAQAAAVAERMARASEELSTQIEHSSHGASEQNDRVHGAATAVDQMNATILEVAQNATRTAHAADTARDKAHEGANIVQDVVTAVTAVRQEAQALSDTMRELGEQAQGIGRIMNVISDIADQTNLLALNAAIEAARAGEAGRGFAVVADEVRKLAEKTMTATKEVGDAIAGIQHGSSETLVRVDRAASAVNEATGLAERSGGVLSDIVSMVEDAGDQVRSIAAAAEEQSASFAEINRAVEAISAIATETAQAMEHSTTAVTELAGQAHTLSTLIADLRESGESAEPETGGNGSRALPA